MTREIIASAGYYGPQRHGGVIASYPIIALIFLYWLTYEWVFFFYPKEYGGPVLQYATDTIKLAVPFFLLAVFGIPAFGKNYNMRARRVMEIYILLFCLLLVWAIIPTLASDTGQVLELFKLIPRLAFFCAILSIFAQDPHAFERVAKCVICVVIFALIQCLGAYISVTPEPYAGGAPNLAGPFGILGNVNSKMEFEYIPFPIYRLTGYWNEPSNASASAFASFFLSNYLYRLNGERIWRYSSYICLGAGLLCFSNAGYIALGVAIFFGLLQELGGFRRGRRLQMLFLSLFVIIFVATGLFGRAFVHENYSDNDFLRAVVGAREESYSGLDEIYGGRLGLAEGAIKLVLENPLGLGLQIVGMEGIEAPSAAPLLWLFLTGVLGLALLISREATVLLLSKHIARESPSSVPVIQAWIVVLVQQASYGSWMNPNYMIMVAAVFSMALRTNYPSKLCP